MSNMGLLVPLISQLLTLGFKIADVIEKSEGISEHDKVAMKVAITTARDNVKHWDDKEIEDNTTDVV